jgi:hypothetical protein
MNLDDIFAGPIVRRAQEDLVTIWLATYTSFVLRFSVRLSGSSNWIGHDEHPFEVRVFPRLYCYLALIRPVASGRFPTNQLLEYSIAEVVGGNGDYSAFENIVAADGLAYGELRLPSFFLQRPGSRLNALYGSCRKIHAKNGGLVDALSFGDDLVTRSFKNLDMRPAALCLGGDQIYADDVHDVCLDDIRTLTAKFAAGLVETLPAGLAVPGKGQRQDFVTRQARFTSAEARNHLITFAEYVAMYGLAWNSHNWTLGSKPPEIASFIATLPKVRRLLANTPTYMIFDDHDVTDDWNLSIRWKEDVKAFKLGKRIVANALAAYWLFQGWGNDPDGFADIRPNLQDAIEGRQQNYAAMEATFWACDAWEFFTPTYPLIYFLNTRTNRGVRDGQRGADRNAPAWLKSVEAWIRTVKTLRRLLSKQSREYPLVLVAPGPVFDFPTIDELQGGISAIIGPYPYDLESWAANKMHFFTFLRICGDQHVVLLSGDVHYGFTSTATVSTFDDDYLREAIRQFPDLVLPKQGAGEKPTYSFLFASKFIQLTSSALKNFAADVMHKVAVRDTGLALLIRGNEFKYGKYTNGVFTIYDPTDLSVHQTVKEEDAKVGMLLRQRVNDVFNARYIGLHNLGWLTIDRQEITNCFYTPNGKESERRWNFASNVYWE